MLRFIIRRVIRGLVAIVTFQTALFFLIQALPYDFATFLVLEPASRQMAQSTLGLDLPLWQQYWNWLSGFFRFDLGSSFIAWPTPVSVMLLERAPRTLILFLTGAILSYLLGIWLGKLIAWNRGGAFELGITLIGVASYTSFAPFMGFVLIMVFAWRLRWLPYQRMIDHNYWYYVPVSLDWVLIRMGLTVIILTVGFILLKLISRKIKSTPRRIAIQVSTWLVLLSAALVWWQQIGYWRQAFDVIEHMILPLSAVVLLSFGETMLLMRTTMLESIEDEYVLTARAKGLPLHIIRDRHVARNAFLPVLTRLLLNLPLVLTGSLAIELVFEWQAMGELIFLGIDYHDIPLLLGILSVVGVLTLLGHIFMDILHVYLDPRLRYAGGYV